MPRINKTLPLNSVTLMGLVVKDTEIRNERTENAEAVTGIKVFFQGDWLRIGVKTFGRKADLASLVLLKGVYAFFTGELRQEKWMRQGVEESRIRLYISGFSGHTFEVFASTSVDRIDKWPNRIAITGTVTGEPVRKMVKQQKVCSFKMSTRYFVTDSYGNEKVEFNTFEYKAIGDLADSVVKDMTLTVIGILYEENLQDGRHTRIRPVQLICHDLPLPKRKEPEVRQPYVGPDDLYAEDTMPF